MYIINISDIRYIEIGSFNRSNYRKVMYYTYLNPFLGDSENVY